MARGLEPLAATNRKEWFLRWIPPIISQLKLKNNVVVVMRKRLTTAEFIDRAREVHGDKYDYSKVGYVNNATKVCIVCPLHGPIGQLPMNHMKGCRPKCCKGIAISENKTQDVEYFINRAREVHGDRYDYSLVDYTGCFDHVTIVCPKHGEFPQQATSHLEGTGCRKCSNEILHESNTLSTEDFIAKAIRVHGDKYDYSNVDYEHSHNKVWIICPEHGEFPQGASRHLSGTGCPKCSTSKGERAVLLLLDSFGIDYETEKTYSDLNYFSEINGRNYPYRFDIYIPHINTLIEYHGTQHYQFEPFFHRDDAGFATRLLRDHIKREYARENGIALREISYEEFDNIESILKELLENDDNL